MVGADADAVERRAVAVGDEGLVVVGDEQLLHRRPQRLKLTGPAEVGFAQEAAGQREHAAFAVGVGRDRAEDGRQPVRSLAIERQRRRQQLRDPAIVKRAGDAVHDFRPAASARVAPQDLNHDVRIELQGRGGQVVHQFRQTFGRHHPDDAVQMTECGEHGGGLRRDHRRAVERSPGRHHRAGQVADIGCARGNCEQPLLRLLGEGRVWAAAADGRDNRSPDVVAPGRFRHAPFFSRQHLLVIDLLEADRRVAFALPDPGRAAAAPPFALVQT